MTAIKTQVRLEEDLHARVAEIAQRLHVPRNSAYQMLIELGIDALVNVERQSRPLRVVNA